MNALPAYVLDAWAVLAYLQGEEPAAGRVRQLLQTAQQQTISLAISVINLGEVYDRVGRVRGPDEADRILSEVFHLPLTVLPAGNETVLAAARLKLQHAISYADAFAAAAALELDAILLTGDPELKGLRSSVRLEELARAARK